MIKQVLTISVLALLLSTSAAFAGDCFFEDICCYSQNFNPTFGTSYNAIKAAQILNPDAPRSLGPVKGQEPEMAAAGYKKYLAVKSGGGAGMSSGSAATGTSGGGAAP